MTLVPRNCLYYNIRYETPRKTENGNTKSKD